MKLKFFFGNSRVFRIVQNIAQPQHPYRKHTIHILPFIELAFGFYIFGCVLAFGAGKFFTRFGIHKLKAGSLNNMIRYPLHNFFGVVFCLRKNGRREALAKEPKIVSCLVIFYVVHCDATSVVCCVTPLYVW